MRLQPLEASWRRFSVASAEEKASLWGKEKGKECTVGKWGWGAVGGGEGSCRRLPEPRGTDGTDLPGREAQGKAARSGLGAHLTSFPFSFII